MNHCYHFYEYYLNQTQRVTFHLRTCLLVLGSLANLCPPRSNSRICLLSWGMATTPLLETASLLAALSALIVASGLRILRSSQTFTLLSSELETILSSLVKTADVTVLGAGNTNI